MRVELSEKFLKELKKLSKHEQERIMKVIKKLEEPFSTDIRKINFEKKVVYVLKFDWRERAYDRL